MPCFGSISFAELGAVEVVSQHGPGVRGESETIGKPYVVETQGAQKALSLFAQKGAETGALFDPIGESCISSIVAVEFAGMMHLCYGLANGAVVSVHDDFRVILVFEFRIGKLRSRIEGSAHRQFQI